MTEQAPAYRFDGAVAFVTGAGSGIGRATALAFARSGARVACTDISHEALGATISLIEGAGGECHGLPADVCRAGDVENAVAATVRAFGRLDMAVNCAGIEPETEMLAETDDDLFDKVVAVNLRSVFLCLKHEIRQMLAQDEGGAIVNVASVAAFRGYSAGYSASKHGVVGLTRTAAVEYSSQGIRVNVICPAAIDTPMLHEAVRMHDLDLEDVVSQMSAAGRVGNADEVAGVAVWLCSGRSSYVMGHPLVVDGGYLAR